MKIHLRVFSLVSLAVISGLAAQNTNTPSLTVMTYNLRFASANPPNAWPVRRPLMNELIQQLAPDVMGTQEGIYSQIKDLTDDLPEFDWIGIGREGGSRGEFMAVFYRKSRLEPLAYDHFWLSDTPDVMNSASWGNKYRRMVTWVKFRDRANGKEFFVFNTHFDHEVQVARENSAKLVRSRIAALDSKLPVLLIGDFNAVAGANKAYDILTGEKFLTDAWLVAPDKHGEGVSTFNDFKRVEKRGERIDWILTRGDVAVEWMEIPTFSRDGQFPSDHFPVVAKVRLEAGKPVQASTGKVIRINAGASSDYTDSEGNVWLSDRGFEGGDAVTRDATMKIENTKDATIYRTEHWGMESFSQAVPNGEYLVKLHFAETWEGVEGAGGRVFTMNVEGKEVADFDIWEKAGGARKPCIETVKVKVADGKLDIRFEAGAESTAINGIEISSLK